MQSAHDGTQSENLQDMVLHMRSFFMPQMMGSSCSETHACTICGSRHQQSGACALACELATVPDLFLSMSGEMASPASLSRSPWAKNSFCKRSTQVQCRVRGSARWPMSAAFSAICKRPETVREGLNVRSV